MKKDYGIPGVVIAILFVVALNLASNWLIFRADLTEDRRYTLSQETLNLLENVDKPILVDVLLEGDLPAEFVRLKLETREILESFASYNSKIKIDFLDPLEGEEEPDKIVAELQSFGLTPANVTTEQDNRVSQELVFPWAMVNTGERTVRVPLLRTKLGQSTEDRINHSIQNLEYAFADALSKLQITERKNIAVIRGNGQLEDIYIADFLTTLNEYYNLGIITLDSVAGNPAGVLTDMREFDMALIAKPTETFSEAEKYVLDQYMVGGGKSLWLIDKVAMDIDSLFNPEGAAVAVPRDLQLDDLFFRYGFRINADLVKDLICTPIVLADGEASSTQYNPLPWVYHPMAFSRNNHPINKNLEALRFQFANSIDTLANDLKKTVLYWSSPKSMAEGTPRILGLDAIQSPPDESQYVNGNIPLAILVEGEFPSAYANRVKPVYLENPVDTGAENKMIVISDGDLIRNQIRQGRPLELGYDKWTNSFYGNKEFLLNSVNYLLDDTGLMNIRNKSVEIPIMDQQQIAESRLAWQLANVGLPLIVLALIGAGVFYFRKKKYRK